MRMIRDSIPSKSMLVAGVVATLVSVALAGIAFATPPSGATAPVGNGARGLRASSPATADTVVEWNLNAARAIFVTAGQPPQQSVPHLAMVHGAVYDAVNAIDGGHEGYLISSRLATSSDSKEAAAATAAYRVLLNIVPAQQSVLDAQYAASLAAIPDSVSKTRGVAVGEAAAAAMIAARTADGRFGPFRFAVGTAPGVWRPVLPAFVNDPNAWLKDVKPFLIQSSSQFRSKGPLALTSRRYAREFAEVKSLGSDTSTTRTADQTLAARYWAENPPATWSRIFRTLSAQQGLSIVENARLFAMLYMSGADALISVWDDKAHFSFWRPITAIREADTDGNSATAPDAAWLPLIPNPPYPEHSSGHTGLSGSFVATLQDFFGTDKLAWTDTNNAGLTRGFTRFSQAIDEIIDARVWSGIHFRTADEQGARIGRQVAKWRKQHYFRPAKK
jgi:PAP2 superfamily